MTDTPDPRNMPRLGVCGAAGLLLALGCCFGGCRTTPTSEVTATSDTGAWRSDFQVFRCTLKKVADTGRTVPLRQLGARLAKKDGSVKVISDGAGGFIDQRPEPGTVQEKVSRYFAGASVRWVVMLSEEPIRGIRSTVGLYLAEDSASRTDKCAEILEIEVSTDGLPGATNLKAGDEVSVEGTIGNSSESTNRRMSGVNAAYHYREGGKNRTVFLVRLDDARVSPAEKSPAVPHKR